MNKVGKILMTSLFIAYLSVIGIYMIVRADHDISNMENRELADKPSFSLEAVADGTFMEDTEAYVKDQFPGRDTWLKSYVDFQLLTDRTYINGHYVADDDWMLAEPEYDNRDAQIGKAVGKLNDFGTWVKDEGMELYYFSVPHKVALMDFILPDYIKKGHYQHNIDYFMDRVNSENVHAVDMTTRFSNEFTEDEIKEMYFKTDHHWNGHGSFLGYKMMEETLKETSAYFPDETPMDDAYQKKCLPEDKQFIGSYNRQLYMMVDTEEELCVYTEETYDDFSITVNGDEVNSSSFYNQAYGNEGKKNINFGELFSFNYAEVTVENKQRKEDGGKILIIKDSYANPMIFQIAQNFYETTYYDPRYNEDRTLKEYIGEHDFDVIAFVYNSAHLTGEDYNFDTYPVEKGD